MVVASDVSAGRAASHGARKHSLAEVMKGEMLASIFPKASLDTLIKIMFQGQQTSHSLLEGEVKPEVSSSSGLTEETSEYLRQFFS